MEDGNLGEGSRLAAATGAYVGFEDEAGQGLRPPKARTWARRGHTPWSPYPAAAETVGAAALARARAAGDLWNQVGLLTRIVGAFSGRSATIGTRSGLGSSARRSLLVVQAPPASAEPGLAGQVSQFGRTRPVS